MKIDDKRKRYRKQIVRRAVTLKNIKIAETFVHYMYMLNLYAVKLSCSRVPRFIILSTISLEFFPSTFTLFSRELDLEHHKQKVEIVNPVIPYSVRLKFRQNDVEYYFGRGHQI